jgi:tryptophanyl-tRNA synthetase
MTKQVILTGLRANNNLHIGNYLGALLPFIDLANKKAGEFQLNLFVPDLHSFTTPIDHSQLYEQTLKNLKVYVAAGLDLNNPDIHIYRQSYIPAHSELTWILDCFTGFGEMSRMTQFKDKASSLSEDRISVGLFNYPVLMAADILLYSAIYIPVGDDQTQHIEFTRDIAERINAKFGEVFTLPKPVQEQHEFFGTDQGLRIRDLMDPTKKMSKSDDNVKGVIFLSDTPDVARQKIMSAATDSFAGVEHDYNQRPGVSNLLDILTLLGGSREEFIGQNQYGPLKSAVADKVAKFLADFQASFAAVDQQHLIKKLEHSEAAMNIQARQTLAKAQQAVGLRPA